MVVVRGSFSSCYKLITYCLFFCPLFSIVCRVILLCLAMFSSSNRPLLCWTVAWTPPLSSTFCHFLSYTGESLTSSLVSMFLRWFKFFDAIDATLQSFIDLLLFLGGIFTSPRLSKLPGWNSKDGTLNLEKVCIWYLKFYAFCGNRS